MERVNSELDSTRRDLRDFGRMIQNICQSQGAYQEPTSITVNFARDGSIRASVTSRATLFIKYDA